MRNQALKHMPRVVLLLLASSLAPVGCTVVELTPADLDSLLAHGTWLLEFYAPWCGYCRSVRKRLCCAREVLTREAHIVGIVLVTSWAGQEHCSVEGARVVNAPCAGRRLEPVYAEVADSLALQGVNVARIDGSKYKGPPITPGSFGSILATAPTDSVHPTRCLKSVTCDATQSMMAVAVYMQPLARDLASGDFQR